MTKKTHECGTIGLQMNKPHTQFITNGMGQRYWKATAKIGALFGHVPDISGDLEGIGRTEREALERLHNATVEFHESMWV